MKRMMEEEWRKLLSPEAFRVLRQAGTERPFTGQYTDTPSDPGAMYVCAGCSAPLFPGAYKFPTHCGWPAFSQAHSPAAIKEVEDATLGMRRVEVRCKGCDGHLGHVFDDGPKESGGMRYCINSAALKYIPDYHPK